jgi:uncharacterized protein YndB with AHSA1/START domain
MSTPSFFQGSFSLNRQWAAPPERIFRAWADPEVKAQWFSGPKDRWKPLHRAVDFRVGGIEVAEGLILEGGVTTRFEARYHLIEADRRLVFVYDLYLSGQLQSITLSSLLLQPVGKATRVSYSEQILFVDGRENLAGRQEGTELHFATIEQILGLTGRAQ